jgi:hypothetical protein
MSLISSFFSLFTMPRATIAEEITYPRMVVTANNPNPCKELSMPYEHLLSCGHLIHTATPKEPCGKTCHHVSSSKGDPSGFSGSKRRTGFSCEACFEEKKAKGVKHKKSAQTRPCYIAAKTVSVPCDKHGNPKKGYTPKPGHPFDTSLPPVGANMFVDISDEAPEEMPDTASTIKSTKNKETKTVRGSISGQGRRPVYIEWDET